MRPLQSLTFEAVVGLLRTHFRSLDKKGDKERTDYLLSDVLMSGLAMMFFQEPSLLQFQERLLRKKGRCNLQTMFGVSAVPKDSQMRERLDQAEPESIRQLLPVLFERMRRVGWAKEWVNEISDGPCAGSYYVMALDGTDYFSSEAISCGQCLVRKDKSGEIHYRHTVVAGTLVVSGSHRVLPLDAEMCGSQDGSEKQDCELNAGKRLIKRVRREHSHVHLIVSGDDLYSHVPFIEECMRQRLHYVLVAKPSSHKELWEWVAELEAMKACEHVPWSVGPACQRKSYEARIMREVPLRADGEVRVTLVEVWERNKAGTQTYHNSWITDLEVTAKKVAEIVGIGRAKWKIENEQFNVQKNHGYHLKHNYGHGKKNLSAVFYYLNLLAYITHIILSRGDRLFQQCRQAISRREEMWNVMRTMMNFVVWESWQQMVAYILDDELRPLPP
jgi:hypothetical protein